MSDDFSRSERTAQAKADANIEARAAETLAIRRRWITLGEVLAVLAVLISALTLWNSWSERADSESAKNHEAQQTSSRAAALVLTAVVSGQAKLDLKPASAEQSVQSQRILFPTALGAAPVETTGAPRIEAGWFEHALKKARNDAHLPDDSHGDERLPVVIATRFLVDGKALDDVSIYDIGYTISGRWITGHKLTLRGLSLVSHAKNSSAQARVDARWKARFPQK